MFQDPAGAFISAWQGTRMGGFQTNSPNSFAWAELNARGVDKALPFYTKVFGWTVKKSPMGDGQPEYNEFQIDGDSVAGAWEMNAMVPAEVPSFWQVYFGVDDVDAAHRKALELGAHGAERAAWTSPAASSRSCPTRRARASASSRWPLADRRNHDRPGTTGLTTHSDARHARMRPGVLLSRAT